jgi:SPFH domain/Band 7 family protein
MTILLAIGVIGLVVLVAAAFSVTVRASTSARSSSPRPDAARSRAPGSCSCCRWWIAWSASTSARLRSPSRRRRSSPATTSPPEVAAVCYFGVIDPAAAVNQIEAFAPATSQIAQTTLRSVLARADLDQLLAERERLNEDLQKIIDDQTEPWGVKVTVVEIKDVEIPEAMQRAMARPAEAERERRAKIIDSEGEFQAAAKLLDAADLISRNPATIQLRYLQTLREKRARRSCSRSRSTCSNPSPQKAKPRRRLPPTAVLSRAGTVSRLRAARRGRAPSAARATRRAVPPRCRWSGAAAQSRHERSRAPPMARDSGR